MPLYSLLVKGACCCPDQREKWSLSYLCVRSLVPRSRGACLVSLCGLSLRFRFSPLAPSKIESQESYQKKYITRDTVAYPDTRRWQR